uniref:Nucleotide-diphospho-sugar transferase domain-containing protein n=1 Tax=Leersia perrieri TaxID=77586 RepID=A0A0D9WXS6_9ORYZ
MTKSATSLLLGAALATVFFLLYTSVCRDLADGPATTTSSSSSPRWSQKQQGTTIATDQGTGLIPANSRQEKVSTAAPIPREEIKKQTKSSGAAKKRKKKKQNEQRIVMPASQQNNTPAAVSTPHQDDLAGLLRRAATTDRKVLVTAINEAWAAPGSFLDLFLESFRHGEGTEHLVRHLLVVAMDSRAFQRCKAIHPFCYWFRVDGMDFAAEQLYMKGDYLEMMWRRNRFQQSILELGYTFLFTDVDILWFRSPFPHIPDSAELVMSSDFFVGDPNSPGNYPNGGLLYVKSCESTIKFYNHWQSSRARFPGKHEQFVFDRIVKEGVPPHVGTRVQFLDTNYFGGFCQHGKDLGKICTMHANCCVGLQNKLFDLRNVLEDWKNYRARVNVGNFEYFSWRVPGRCIH